MSVRPAMFGAHPIRFLFLLLVILGGIAGAIFFMTAMPNPPVAIGCGVAAVITIIGFIAWKIASLSQGLKITTKRTIETKGLLSKATSEVLHADIKNIQVRQSFMDRILNVGNLALSSAAENEDEITMTDCPNPGKVRDVIDLYRPL
jgi:uncharacterized membrane protein YdbT with pleckstrin-like domain